MALQVHDEERGKCEAKYIIAFVVLRHINSYILMFIRSATVYLMDRPAAREEFYQMEYAPFPEVDFACCCT